MSRKRGRGRIMANRVVRRSAPAKEQIAITHVPLFARDAYGYCGWSSSSGAGSRCGSVAKFQDGMVGSWPDHLVVPIRILASL